MTPDGIFCSILIISSGSKRIKQIKYLPRMKNFLHPKRAVVVAQLVERLLPIPEICGLNPVIGKKLLIYWTFVYCQMCIEKTKIKQNRPGMAHFFKKVLTKPDNRRGMDPRVISLHLVSLTGVCICLNKKMFKVIRKYWNHFIQTSQTGDQLYNSPSPTLSVLFSD